MQDFRMAMRFGTAEQSGKYQRYSDWIDARLSAEAKRKEEEERLKKIRKAEAEEQQKKEKEIQRKQTKKEILNLIKIVVVFVLVILVMKALIPAVSKIMDSTPVKNYAGQADKLITSDDKMEDYVLCALDALKVGFDENGEVVMDYFDGQYMDFISKDLYKFIKEVHEKTKGKDVYKLYSTGNREDLIILYRDGTVDIVDGGGIFEIKGLAKWKNIVEIRTLGNYAFGMDTNGKMHKLKICDSLSIPSDDDVNALSWNEMTENNCVKNVVQ